MANQDLVFDITKSQDIQLPQQRIFGRVGDGGLKAVTVLIQQNGRRYDLTGLTPIFEGVKSDNSRVIDSSGGTLLDPQGGIFRYVFPAQTFAVEGTFKQAFFKLMRGDQSDSTLELEIVVLKNLVEIGINSTDYITDFEKICQQLEKQAELFSKQLQDQVNSFQAQIAATKAKAEEVEVKMAILQEKIKANDLVTNAILENKLAKYKTVVYFNPELKQLV